jgi:SAM-dependent methyltransferase
MWDWLLSRWLDPEDDGRRFDATYGTETRWFDLWNYEPTPPRIVDEVLAALPVEPSALTFVDLGSGKGRVVLLASRHPFRAVVGIEHRASLHAAADRNRQIFERSGEVCSPIHLLCGDVARYPLPDGPILVWLFNPFGPDVLRPLVQRLQRPEVYVAYVLPIHHDLLQDAGFCELARGGDSDWPWQILGRRA